MIIGKQIRTDSGARRADRRYPTMYTLQEGVATEQDVSRLAQTLASAGQRALAQGLSDPLYLNLLNNLQGLLKVKGIADIDQDAIRAQAATIMDIYEYVDVHGDLPATYMSNRYDYIAAKRLLKYPVPPPPELVIQNDDVEVNRLLTAYGL